MSKSSWSVSYLQELSTEADITLSSQSSFASTLRSSSLLSSRQSYVLQYYTDGEITTRLTQATRHSPRSDSKKQIAIGQEVDRYVATGSKNFLTHLRDSFWTWNSVPTHRNTRIRYERHAQRVQEQELLVCRQICFVLFLLFQDIVSWTFDCKIEVNILVWEILFESTLVFSWERVPDGKKMDQAR